MSDSWHDGADVGDEAQASKLCLDGEPREVIRARLSFT